MREILTPWAWLLACKDLETSGTCLELLSRLRTAYAEPHRAYHTWAHIEEGLLVLRDLLPSAQRPGELLMAWFFHDAIYDPRAQDNEELSAAWAQEELRSSGVGPAAARRVADLVLATRHARAEALPCADAALLLDADLAILGAPPERYAQFEAQIRQEYAWVSQEAYCQGRRAVLLGFAARVPLYHSALMAGRQAQARRNLEAAAAGLVA